MYSDTNVQSVLSYVRMYVRFAGYCTGRLEARQEKLIKLWTNVIKPDH